MDDEDLPERLTSNHESPYTVGSMQASADMLTFSV